jgi:hypothetical protein
MPIFLALKLWSPTLRLVGLEGTRGSLRMLLPFALANLGVKG